MSPVLTLIIVAVAMFCVVGVLVVFMYVNRSTLTRTDAALLAIGAVSCLFTAVGSLDAARDLASQPPESAGNAAAGQHPSA